MRCLTVNTLFCVVILVIIALCATGNLPMHDQRRFMGH